MTALMLGKPCRVCGSRVRYKSTEKCVKCCRANGIKRYRLNPNAPEYLHADRTKVEFIPGCGWEDELIDTRTQHLPPMPWSGSDSGFISEIPLSRLMAGR